MTNAHSFPLLRLPCLAREHVVKVMDFREQYFFATLSKKSKSVAKIGVRRLSYNFFWELTSYYIRIAIQNSGTGNWFGILIQPMNGDVASDPLKRICLNVEDIEKTSMEELEFIKDVFKISSFKIQTIYISNEFTKQFLAKVQGLKIGIDELEVMADGPDNEMFGWIMENCRDVKRLTNHCATTGDFQWDSQKPFTSEYVSLYDAPWFTMDHLTRLFLGGRFFEIILGHQHKLTVENLNQLVKMWIHGSTIEFVRIETLQLLDFDQIMRDIEKEPIREAYIENYLEPFSEGQAYKIRQQCGKEAVVCLSGTQFTISTHFDNPLCDLWDLEEEDEEDEEDEDNEHKGEDN